MDLFSDNTKDILDGLREPMWKTPIMPENKAPQKMELRTGNIYVNTAHEAYIVLECEAEANYQLDKIVEQVREETAREIFDWFREFAIHGGKTPLDEVLDIMRTHSKYAKYLPQEKK